MAGMGPIPLEAALQHQAGTAAGEVEARAHVDLEEPRHLPVATREQLVHFRLCARADIDALHLAIVFERWRKALSLPADQQGRLEVPSVLRAGPMQGALEDRIENDLP